MNEIMYFLLSISLLFNILFFKVEILPILPKYMTRLKKRFSKTNIRHNSGINKVERVAQKMLYSNIPFMPAKDHSDFILELYKIFRFRTQKHICYNYPKAFLLYGYTLLKKESSEKKTRDFFDIYLDQSGKSTFSYDKIDQAVFGLSYLVNYVETRNPRFMKGSIEIFEYIKSSINDDYGIVLYRQNGKCELLDTLGMICPFLFMFSRISNNSFAEILAHKQIENYINKALDMDSQLPFHGYDLVSGLKLGPIHWGRGIGWYVLALSFGVVYSTDEIKKKDYISRLRSIEHILSNNRNKNGSWNQFIGNGYHSVEDSSATSMYIFSMMFANIKFYPKTEIEKIFVNMIDKDGYVKNCSGDTFGLNRYAYSFGLSELSQGFLCAILSLYNSNK